MDRRIAFAFPQGARLKRRVLEELSQTSKLYVIYLTPRSGSTWLTDLCINSGVLGAPQEWFNPEWIQGEEELLGCRPPKLAGTHEINDYVRAIVDLYRSPFGLAGIEFSASQARALKALMDKPVNPDIWTAQFYIRRQDVIAQGISLYRSVESGRFHSYQDSPEAKQAFASVNYDAEKILGWIAHVIDCEQDLERQFGECGVEPIRFFYEDLCARPMSILNQMSDALDAPRTKAPISSLSAIGGRINRWWKDRLLREASDKIDDILAGRPPMRGQEGSSLARHSRPRLDPFG